MYSTYFDCPEKSPWGEIQEYEMICPGVYQVSTASHGGIMLRNEHANRLLSPAARKCAFREHGYTCFEEDCAATVPLLELLDKGLHKAPKHFTPEEYREALERSVQIWHPHYWQARERMQKAAREKQMRLPEGR